MPDDREEWELIEAARAGDARAFEALLHLHEARVLRVLRLMGIRREEREDVAQEVFLRLFRGLPRFKRGGPFGSWVYKIAANSAFDWRAGRARASREEAPWDDRLTASAHDAAPGAKPADERLDLARRLEAALDLLSDRERAVFVLIEVEGLEREAAAHALGLNVVTIRRHLSLAKDRLREALEASEKKTPVR